MIEMGIYPHVVLTIQCVDCKCAKEKNLYKDMQFLLQSEQQQQQQRVNKSAYNIEWFFA